MEKTHLCMPITDPNKKQIAQQRRLFYKICFDCGEKIPYLLQDAENVMEKI